MKMPDRLIVGHLIFTIKFGDSALMREAKAIGILDDILLTITLDPTANPRLLAETALHEALHSLYTAYSFGADALEEEQLVSRMAGPLLKLRMNNPDFFLWLDHLMK